MQLGVSSRKWLPSQAVAANRKFPFVLTRARQQRLVPGSHNAHHARRHIQAVPITSAAAGQLQPARADEPLMVAAAAGVQQHSSARGAFQELLTRWAAATAACLALGLAVGAGKASAAVSTPFFTRPPAPIVQAAGEHAAAASQKAAEAAAQVAAAAAATADAAGQHASALMSAAGPAASEAAAAAAAAASAAQAALAASAASAGEQAAVVLASTTAAAGQAATGAQAALAASAVSAAKAGEQAAAALATTTAAAGQAAAGAQAALAASAATAGEQAAAALATTTAAAGQAAAGAQAALAASAATAGEQAAAVLATTTAAAGQAAAGAQAAAAHHSANAAAKAGSLLASAGSAATEAGAQAGALLASAADAVPGVQAAAASAVQPCVASLGSTLQPVMAHQLSAAGLQYKLSQVAAGPLLGRVALLAAALAPVVLAGAALHRLAAGGSFQASMAQAFALVGGGPGVAEAREKGWAAGLVLQALFWAGCVAFAVLVGVVAEDVARQAKAARAGNTPVVERGHTVVVGWSDRLTVPLLQQLVASEGSWDGSKPGLQGPFVVLADRSKADMDEQVARELGGEARRVTTRAGPPARPASLQRAAAGAASTVLLLWPEDAADAAEASAQQAAVLAALRAVGGGVQAPQTVVLQRGQDAGEASTDVLQYAADPAGQAGCRELAPTQPRVAQLATAGIGRLTQLLGQVANSPGLEDALADLLENDGQGAQLSTAVCPEQLAGKPLRHVRRSYDSVTLVGFQAPGKPLQLNPADDSAPVPAGSTLVFVGASGADAAPLEKPYQPRKLKLAGRRKQRAAPRNITLLCWDADAAEEAVRSVAQCSARGSHLRLVCEGAKGLSTKAMQRGSRGVRVTLHDASPTSTAALKSRAAGLQDADAVVLCGLDGKHAAAADTQVVASVLQLQALAAQHGGRHTPLAIVAAVAAPDTEELLFNTVLSQHADLRAEASARAAAVIAERQARAAASGSAKKQRAAASPTVAEASRLAAAYVSPAVSLHVVRPAALLSSMIAHVAAEPALADVFGELSSTAGAELYLRSPVEAYGLPLAAPLAWGDVAEAVRASGRRETAVGVLREAASRCAGAEDEAAAIALAGDQLAELYFPDAQLGLAAADTVVLGPRDRLVVLAAQA